MYLESGKKLKRFKNKKITFMNRFNGKISNKKEIFPQTVYLFENCF
jgi:hypothetical protein